jgi:hypothetical protein
LNRYRAGALIVIDKYPRAVAIPAVDEKQAERQTFEVFKTWKV